MTRVEHFRLLADYNRCMNEKIRAAVSTLPGTALTQDQGAFFGSILGTLNHLLVADIIWLKRFALHPAAYASLADLETVATPTSLDQILHHHLDQLQVERAKLDLTISRWCADMRPPDLDHSLVYANMQGAVTTRNYSALVTHMFNHQTHHRGQISTLLSQNGQDIGVTDLLELIPDETVTAG